MEWLFKDPPNLAVITTRQVIERREAVTTVSHDSDDGGWQFLGVTVEMTSAMLIGLGQAVAHDPSVVELHDLPLGWRAVRASLGAPWRRERQ